VELNININDISETAFLTVYCHALDAKSVSPILNDKSSVRTTELLNEKLSSSNRKLHKLLLKEKIKKSLIVHTAVRAKQYDKYVNDFVRKHPDAAIINIGCGLDNRFERVDNGSLLFYDLDMPDIINIKRQIFEETERYKYFSQSVFDFSWINEIKSKNVMFLAEGVFMYCAKDDVKSLILKLQKSFPGSELVCEMVNSLWLKDWIKPIMNIKLQKELYLGKEAVFHFGINNRMEMEDWNKGIKFINDWCYFDSDEKAIGWIKIFRNVKLFRNTQYTVHYKLDS